MTTHDIFHQTICHDAAGDLDAALMAEYTSQMDPALEERVKQGFLMPILFGYFGSDDDRSTYEGPIQGWVADVEAAGFRVVGRKLIYRYWWADAYLLAARA